MLGPNFRAVVQAYSGAPASGWDKGEQDGATDRNTGDGGLSGGVRICFAGDCGQLVRLGLGLRRLWSVLERKVRLVRIGLGLPWSWSLLERQVRRVRLGLGLQRRTLFERQVRLVRIGLGLQDRSLFERQVPLVRLGLGLQGRSVFERQVQ